MAAKRVEEFRYYEMPIGRYDLALLGDSWITNYKTREQHFHNYFEIGYCYFGEGMVLQGERWDSYGPGAISLIPSYFPHGVQNEGEDISRWEFLYLDLNGFVEDYYPGGSYEKRRVLAEITQFPIVVNEKDYLWLCRVVRAILEEEREPKVLNKEVIGGYMFVLIQELIRLNRIVSAEHEKEDLHIEKIRPALVYIETHYQEEIKINELADCCNVSEPHFRKLFRKCMNISPLEHINTVRIQKACDLLQKKDYPVSELAWQVGYTSVSTFERNFKKIVGQSPKQWRLKSLTNREFVSYQTKVLRGWLE